MACTKQRVRLVRCQGRWPWCRARRARCAACRPPSERAMTLESIIWSGSAVERVAQQRAHALDPVLAVAEGDVRAVDQRVAAADPPVGDAVVHQPGAALERAA